jgi:hypothetical protein
MHRNGRKPPAAPAPSELQINLTERHTYEQLSLELQRVVAILQDHGVYGVEKFRMRLLPLDEQGNPVALFDEDGQQITVIDIPEKPKEKPYRDNEPGLGVSPPGPGSTRAAPRPDASAAARPAGYDPSRK